MWSRSPITSVICHDRSKWMTLIEKIIFYFTILLCQRSNFPSQPHPSAERQLNPSYFLEKKKKARALCGLGRVSVWQLGYQEPSADYHAVEQRLLMITSHFRQN